MAHRDGQGPRLAQREAARASWLSEHVVQSRLGACGDQPRCSQGRAANSVLHCSRQWRRQLGGPAAHGEPGPGRAVGQTSTGGEHERDEGVHKDISTAHGPVQSGPRHCSASSCCPTQKQRDQCLEVPSAWPQTIEVVVENEAGRREVEPRRQPPSRR